MQNGEDEKECTIYEISLTLCVCVHACVCVCVLLCVCVWCVWCVCRYFERDVQCIREFFKRKYAYESELYPEFSDVE